MTCERFSLVHLDPRTEVHAVAVSHPFLDPVPMFALMVHPGSLTDGYSAVRPESVEAVWSRHTLTARPKTRFPVRSVGASMRWGDREGLVNAQTYLESLNEVIFAMQENGTFVRTDVDITCVYMRRDQARIRKKGWGSE